MSGSIKTYTPNFKMIIPEFNVATWHDYIEENFRSIDALFHNLFGINGFSGMWKTNSQYTNGQVLFVGEDNDSIYEGRLVKVVNDTNTGGFATFSEAIKANPKDYELYADASSAQIFSELARDWANKTDGTIKTPEGDDTGEYSAKHYQTLAKGNEEQCEMYKNLSHTNAQLAQDAANSAETSAQNSETSEQNALVSEQNSKTSETNAKTSEDNALSYKNSAQSSASSAQTSAQNAENSATIATNAANSSNVQTVVTNISAINNCSTNMSVIKDAPIQANRAKQYADQAQTLTEGSLNGTHITNCITETPQDIKLELNNNTLTLKAGSKVYIPRTNNEFLEVTISGDLSYTYSDASSKSKLFYNLTTNSIFGETNTGSGSGTNPSQAYYTYYDVDLNVVRRSIDGSTWEDDELSLPLCDMTSTQGTGITSIDHIFNGFGYIGSTVFALPGIKGLIPNGRNEDGTLNNIEFTTDGIWFGHTTYDTNNASIGIVPSLKLVNYVTTNDVIYNAEQNKNISLSNNTHWKGCLVGNISVSNGAISSLQTKTTFHALDYNDRPKITYWE